MAFPTTLTSRVADRAIFFLILTSRHGDPAYEVTVKLEKYDQYNISCKPQMLTADYSSTNSAITERENVTSRKGNFTIMVGG